MALDIDSFKNDLDQLKNQRSLIQAKLDEANRHIQELTSTLNQMGFSSVAEAKQAYVDQCVQAESQHALVKQLIQEINQVSNRVPTREEVMSRLNELSAAPVKIPEVAVSVEIPVTSVPENAVDVIQENIVPPVSNVSTEMSSDSSTDLGNMLFASL